MTVKMRRSLASTWITLLLGLAACSANVPAPTRQAILLSTALPPRRPSATAVPTFTPALEASSTASPTTSPEPTRPVLNFSNPVMSVLAENLPGPDDLLLAPDGSIYISDVSDGTVKLLMPDGKLHVLLTGLGVPEGMVLLPDGSLVIAEQGKNRLVRYDPQAKLLKPFFNLENKTRNAGVDGISLDTWHGEPLTIIIPDSPNGSVLRLSLDGQKLTEIARGFLRPTGAWVEPDGSILVVDENAGLLSRIHPDGNVVHIVSLPTPDDVIEDGAGNIFVCTLGDNAIHVIQALTKQDILLVRGLNGPQGLIFDAAGDLVVTDSGNHRLVKISLH
jgi:streptogramin lyase